MKAQAHGKVVVRDLSAMPFLARALDKMQVGGDAMHCTPSREVERIPCHRRSRR
jgi:hypothetical protein